MFRCGIFLSFLKVVGLRRGEVRSTNTPKEKGEEKAGVAGGTERGPHDTTDRWRASRGHAGAGDVRRCNTGNMIDCRTRRGVIQRRDLRT
jgi:hypothetical protein